MLRLKFSFDGAIQSGSITENATTPDTDPYALDNPGTSPYFARSDDPRFDAADQHETTRLSRTMLNASGTALVAGDIVIMSAGTADNSFTTTTTASYSAGRVGILLDDIAAGSAGLVAYEGIGYYSPTIASGTPAAGDYLFTSTTAGAASYGTAVAAGAFGRVVSTDGTDIGTVDLWGEPVQSVGGGGLDSVTDGTTTVTSVTDIAFAGADFEVTDGGSGEADVAIAAPTAISPSQLTANTDDWAPSGLSGADIIRASTDASRNLTGITAPSAHPRAHPGERRQQRPGARPQRHQHGGQPLPVPRMTPT